MTGPDLIQDDSRSDPPKDPRGPRESTVAVAPVFLVFVAAVGLGYVASGLALSLAAWVTEGAGAARSTEALARMAGTLGGILPAVVAIACTELLVVLLALRAFRAPMAVSLRLGPSGGKPAVMAAAILAMLLLSHGLDTLLQLTGLGDYGTLALLKNVFQDASPRKLIASVLVVGVLAATVEEILFRGFMQTRLRARWGPAAAIVATSLCFGLAHFDPIQGPSAVVLGLFLGAITEWSGSLRPAILCHVVNNTFGTLAPAVISLNDRPGVYPVSMAIAFAGLVFLIPWLRLRLMAGRTRVLGA